MTIQEAIKRLSVYTDEYTYLKHTVEYHSMAVRALKKQIPMKPIELGDGRCECPVCHSNERTLGHYCDHCGQKIDWGDGCE